MEAHEKQAAPKRRNIRKGPAVIAALAVAVVIVFNLLTACLPEEWAQFDLTDSGIYEITNISRDYLSLLERDVTIHVLTDQKTLDTRIVRFLDKYEGLSEHLTIEYTDPVVFPSVLSAYGVDAETVVVTCEETGRQESFLIDDIIGYDEMSYYYYGIKNETDFDAEGLLTTAIDNVLTDEKRLLYEAAGHEETPLSEDLTEQLRRAHMAVATVNLLTDGGIPEDCALLLFNAPARDLADDELRMVLDYLASGGQVFYAMSGSLTPLPNFESLCKAYGMTVQEGVIADMGRYYNNNPALFFPIPDPSVDAADGLDGDSMILFYGARGMTLTEPEREDVQVSAFLSTSEDGYAILDEYTQTQGSYVVGAVATEEIDDGRTSRLTALGAPSLTDPEIAAAFTNLDNTTLFLSAVSAGFEDLPSLLISPVSLETPINSIATSGIWSLLFILVLPLGLLACGFARWTRRRKG